MPTPFNSTEILQYHVGMGHNYFTFDGNCWEIEQAPDGVIKTNRYVEPAEVDTFETIEEPPTDLVWHSGDAMNFRFQQPLPDVVNVFGSNIVDLFSEVKKVGNFPIGSLDIAEDGTISFFPDRINTDIIVPGVPPSTLESFQNLKGRLPIGRIDNNDNRHEAMRTLVFYDNYPSEFGTTERDMVDWLTDPFMYTADRISVDVVGQPRHDQLGNTFFGVKGHILRAVVRRETNPGVQGDLGDIVNSIIEGLHFCSPGEVSDWIETITPAPVVTGSWTTDLKSYEINGVPQPIGGAFWDIGPIIDSQYHGLGASINSIMAKGVCVTFDLIIYEA